MRFFAAEGKRNFCVFHQKAGRIGKVEFGRSVRAINNGGVNAPLRNLREGRGLPCDIP